MDVGSMRVEYGSRPLRRADLKPNPFDQFEAWFKEALGAGLVEPNAMSLATVDAEQRPVLRTVLLKQWDASGFVFFTNLESRKARHIAANPEVSLLFPWLPLQRQLAIRGEAERVPAAEVLAYFVTRPFSSRLAAWISPQSSVITTRSLLEIKWEEMKRKFADGHVPVPSFWGGFRVVPREFEFWQGQSSRLHDRFQYVRTAEGGWRIDRLAP
jgi:pyridoxamine 5'-phosphate oxidase